MLVNIRTLTGKIIPYEFEGSSTVSNLKEYIQEKEGTPINLQKLIYKGKTLDNKERIENYKIPDKSIIHLVLR